MRYTSRNKLDNHNTNYKELFDKRNVKGIIHYSSPNFKYPTAEQMENITLLEHIWGFEDKYYKLAIKHYGSADYWWVIAMFNKTPSETMIELGQTIYIPKPIQVILSIMKA